MRKTISLVLAVLMMLVLIPFGKLNSAVAEDAAKTYQLVTSAEDLTAGNTYLIAGIQEDGSCYVLSRDRGNNRFAYQVAIADGAIALNAAQIASSADDELAYELTLGGNATDGWSFYDTILN